MKDTSKRAAPIALIMVAAIVLGILTNILWNGLDRLTHPDTYNDIIKKYSAKFDVPEEVVYAIIKVESGFDPRAVSSSGAVGLMQMKPATFMWLTGEEHLGEFLSESTLTDPEVSIRYGTYYLRYLLNKFPVTETAIAAYNGGEGNVAKWLSDPKHGTEDGRLINIPHEEPRNYVVKVTKEIQKYKNIYFEKQGD